MSKFLLDANLSPLTAAFLRRQGYDTKSITESKQGKLKDPQIVKLAKKEQRTVISFDLDFGEIYHQHASGEIGVIILRLKDQTVESVNPILNKFLTHHRSWLKKHPHSLIVIKAKSIRFIR